MILVSRKLSYKRVCFSLFCSAALAAVPFETMGDLLNVRGRRAKCEFLYLFLLFFLLACHFPFIISRALVKGDRYLKSCKNTIQGRHLLADDQGYVCGVLSIDPLSGCCPQTSEQFSCQGCDFSSQCCDSYEFCVSCCLNPSQTLKELAVQTKVAKHATAGTYGNVFNYCVGRCRHNSASVIHENAYASEMHHCFSSQLNSSEGLVMPHSEVESLDISIIIARKGQSCTSACKSKGQTCIFRRLFGLNKCEVLQKYMSCKGACIGSVGSDQPAVVIDSAPRHLHPGACLFSTKWSFLSCDGSHPYTRRLCPCA